MEDLSHLFPDPFSALCPTSQEAGNQTSSNANAHTAPGSPPVDNIRDDEKLVQVDPKIVATAYDTPVVVGEGGAKPNEGNGDRSDPFDVDDGAGWKRGHDVATPLPETFGRPKLRLGQWNEI